MSQYQLSSAQYQADFLVTPGAIAAAVTAGLLLDPSWSLLAAGVAGWLAWIGAEWFTHKHVFHRLYRREHWAHHLRPAADIGIKPLYTITAQAVLYAGLVGGLGWGIGGGLFVGYALGYLGYLCTHHAFHRMAVPPGHWLRPAYERHAWHHQGHEVNFNVLIPWGDRLFGTYYQPPPGVIA